MSDLKLIFDPLTFNGDLSFGDFDLETDDTLKTAVLMSIFTWRRANPDDEVPDSDLKGWWGDSYSERENSRIGSRLWLMFREKITEANLRKTNEIISESLQWLIDDGVAHSITVDAQRDLNHSINTVSVQIDIARTNGLTESLKFENLWKGITP